MGEPELSAGEQEARQGQSWSRPLRCQGRRWLRTLAKETHWLAVRTTRRPFDRWSRSDATHRPSSFHPMPHSSGSIR
jgi:hypothetical protein